MQTRVQSVVETVTGTSLGFAGSWIICYGIFSTVDDIATATTISTVACTVWSLARGYAVRRYFARRHQHASR